MKKELLLGNEKFLNSFKNKELLKALVQGQHPKAIVITCSDSRVIPEEIFSQTFGDLFVIRTAGNVTNEGELASIEYGIEHLRCSLVVVMGHTHCGAIHASIHNAKGLYLDPILNRIKKNIADIQDEREASKINALKEVDCIKKMFPNYQGEVIATLYDLETNKVEEI